MTHILSAPRRAVALTLTLALASASLLGAFGVSTADAATPPVVNRDASGVTTDVLPTTQINAGGYVLDQAIVGDTVYVGGSFSSARPAGAAAGTSESPRKNLLAFSLSTGQLIGSFAPSVNGIVRSLALSPDKSRLYVGGDFTAVDGAARGGIVAFSTATRQVDPAFKGTVNGQVWAVDATASTVYVGGSFTTANGVDRKKLASFTASAGSLLGWKPTTDGTTVRALLVAPGGNVIVGGSFAKIGVSGTTLTDALGSASLNPTTGVPQPWAVNKVVKQYGSSGGVLSLRTDGTTVYGAGFWFGGTQSNYEGVWAVNPSGGAITWLADCHGDTYDTTIANGVVYAASHQHDCSNIGGFTEQSPRLEWRANAFTASVQGDVQHNTLDPTKFKDFYGYKAPALVNWLPQFTNGPSTGPYDVQPTISIESNADYVVVGGQFPSVNGKAQQGIARFASPSKSPHADGPQIKDPQASATTSRPTVRAVAGNLVRVTWPTNWDRDDAKLRYELWRTDKTAPIYSTGAVTSLWWRKATLAYTDPNVTAGNTYTYYVKAIDGDGNVGKSLSQVVTPSGASITDSAYSKQVVADGAKSYWRLDDASGTAATDYVGQQDLTLGTGLSLGASGAIGSDRALGSDGTSTASGAPTAAVPGPQTYTTEAWFKTTSTTGGQVVGFQSTRTGDNGSHDRQVYLTPASQVVYYLNPGTARSIASPKAYNDGAWHQVVATLSPTAGMVLYVDGARVASWSSVTAAQDYSGYWRVAGGRVPGTGSGYLKGSVDDVSVYPTALSAAQVADHYTDARGSAPTATPTVAFKTDCSGLTCSYDASSSAPEATTDSPTITSYAWNFGDGSTASGAKAKHVYKKAQAYDVRLTVENSDAGRAMAVQTVEAAGNSVPVPSFTTKVKSKKVTVDAKKSVDFDGKIASYRWTFGDGSTSTKKKASHSYVGTGRYAVTLTVTDDQGATDTKTTVVVIGKALATDTFERTGDGWGTADKGGAWTTDPASAFALADGRGELTLGEQGDGATALLPKVSSTKANVVADVRLDGTPAGAGTTAGFVLRQRSAGEYRTKLVVRDGGELYLGVSRVVDGTEKNIKSVQVKNVSFAADAPLRVRATISSATKAKIKVTVWRAGTKEPKAQLSTSDSTKALRKSGTVGVWGYQGADAPVVVGFDDLLVTSS